MNEMGPPEVPMPEATPEVTPEVTPEAYVAPVETVAESTYNEPAEWQAETYQSDSSLDEMPEAPMVEVPVEDTVPQLEMGEGVDEMPEAPEIEAGGEQASEQSGVDELPEAPEIEASGEQAAEQSGVDELPEAPEIEAGGEQAAEQSGVDELPEAPEVEAVGEQAAEQSGVDELPEAPEVEASGEQPAEQGALDEMPEAPPIEKGSEAVAEGAGAPESEEEIPKAPAVEGGSEDALEAAEFAKAEEQSPKALPLEAHLETSSDGIVEQSISDKTPANLNGRLSETDDSEHRNSELRAESRDNKIAAIKEQYQSGIWPEDTANLDRDTFVAVAEGEMTLEEAGLEVHHTEGLKQLGSSATDPQNTEILTEMEHRWGAHGGDTNKPTYGVHRNPEYGNDIGFGSDRQRGVSPMEDVEQTMNEQAARDWPSEEDRLLDRIDSARNREQEGE